MNRNFHSGEGFSQNKIVGVCKTLSLSLTSVGPADLPQITRAAEEPPLEVLPCSIPSFGEWGAAFAVNSKLAVLIPVT